MKRILLLLSLGIIGTLAVLKTINQKREAFDAVTDAGKNFGAFPPEIPPQQFDDLFI
ncbi:MAG: hypothetical protein HBSIN02_23310 [Bacteroidia bacterium]|nr:MAG: hypothetical protein HBSIN02_23310 [Bacteroidia bacterium]